MNYSGFFKWFQGLGGRVPDRFEEVLNTRYVYDAPPVSSFKSRAEEIKKKYNHKFKQLKVKDDFLSKEPNIFNILFVKK